MVIVRFFTFSSGLYTVEKAWFTTGISGYGVWKFALKRLDDQAPPPWEFTEVR